MPPADCRRPSCAPRARRRPNSPSAAAAPARWPRPGCARPAAATRCRSSIRGPTAAPGTWSSRRRTTPCAATSRRPCSPATGRRRPARANASPTGAGARPSRRSRAGSACCRVMRPLRSARPIAAPGTASTAWPPAATRRASAAAWRDAAAASRESSSTTSRRRRPLACSCSDSESSRASSCAGRSQARTNTGPNSPCSGATLRPSAAIQVEDSCSKPRATICSRTRRTAGNWPAMPGRAAATAATCWSRLRNGRHSSSACTTCTVITWISPLARSSNTHSSGPKVWATPATEAYSGALSTGAGDSALPKSIWKSIRAQPPNRRRSRRQNPSGPGAVAVGAAIAAARAAASSRSSSWMRAPAPMFLRTSWS